MLDVKKLLAKILTNRPDIKVVYFFWTMSPSASAGSRLLQNASPSNSSTPSAEPAGYTFVCWIDIWSNGWVGAPYASSPANRTTDIWTATAKSTTSGASIGGLALYKKTID